jgi:isocitrate/isopropylmalate dehydrogenase
MILSAGLMLRHLGRDHDGERVEKAVASVLAEGKLRTADLRPEGEPATTDQIADAIAAAL